MTGHRRRLLRPGRKSRWHGRRDQWLGAGSRRGRRGLARADRDGDMPKRGASCGDGAGRRRCLGSPPQARMARCRSATPSRRRSRSREEGVPMHAAGRLRLGTRSRSFSSAMKAGQAALSQRWPRAASRRDHALSGARRDLANACQGRPRCLLCRARSPRTSFGPSIAQRGSLLTLEDLARTEASWVEPISTTFAGIEMLEIPPNGQGITALIALNILPHFDLDRYGPGQCRAPALSDRGDEARLGLRNRHIADPEFTDVPVAEMLSAETARAWRAIVAWRAPSSGRGRRPALAALRHGLSDGRRPNAPGGLLHQLDLSIPSARAS